MFLFRFSRASFRVDSKVVHVYGEPPLGYLLMEYGIHHHLECGRGVCEAKKHDHWFKESLGGKECRFPFVSWFYVYVIVPPSYVEFGE